MNLNKLSEFRFGNTRQIEVKRRNLDLDKSQNIRESAVERNKQFNMSQNLFSII
jgi:23S rRNA maturation-related 3'-5' exoribonuclease YhaM